MSPMADEKKDPTEAESPKKYPVRLIRGFPFPAHILFQSNIESVIDFKPNDTDIFVVTYPKCGTTWMQFIIWEIMHKGATPPSPNQMQFREFPFLEATGVEGLEDKPPPRTLKTHLPFHLQPYNPKTKYIYVVRNPWDCCVSFYYHMKETPDTPQLTFDEHFELFITGQVPFGDFFDHALSWFEHRNDPNVLFVTYEDMKKDRKKAFMGIAKFLGDSFYEGLKSEEVLENCVKHTDFKYMKGLGMFFPKDFPKGDSHKAGGAKPDLKAMQDFMAGLDRQSADPKLFKEANFFRKGEVGDWKNHFSPSQVKKFNEYMIRKLKNTQMENFWQPLLEETTL